MLDASREARSAGAGAPLPLTGGGLPTASGVRGPNPTPYVPPAGVTIRPPATAAPRGFTPTRPAGRDLSSDDTIDV